MQQGQFKIIDDYLCIRMPKEIDHHNAEILSKKVDNYIYGEKVNHVVFDFIDTEFMDSSGIGMIVGRYKKVKAIGGSIYIMCGNNNVRKILEISGVFQFAKICEDINDAV